MVVIRIPIYGMYLSVLFFSSIIIIIIFFLREQGGDVFVFVFVIKKNVCSCVLVSSVIFYEL